jgi:spermidine synthase
VSADGGRSEKPDVPFLLALASTGLTALAIEVIWSRAMIPWVGGTALSQIATVAIYMIGLFLGSALAVPRLSRIADPRAAFLKLEALAALLSLAAVFALPFADPLFALFSRGELLGSGLGSLLRGLSGGGLMLPATILMGFSFPLAIAAFDRGRGERGAAALAYGVNTLGATAGTMIGGLLLVPWLGVHAGAIAVVAADLAVLVAVAFSKAPAGATAAVELDVARREPAKAASTAGPTAPAAAAGTWRDELPMLASILVGGMVSLGLEAILFRVLGLLLGPTARAFTMVLTVYVLGLGGGSLLARFLVERSRRAAELVYLASWVVVGAYGLVVHSQTGYVSALIGGGEAPVRAYDLFEQLALRAWVAGAVLLPITVAFGASYSAAVAAAPRSSAGRAGRLYAALTLGNVLGLAAAAWGVLPNFRLDHGLRIVLGVAFVAPLPALFATSLRLPARLAGAALLLGGVAFAAFGAKDWPLRLLHTAAYMHDSPTQGSGAERSIVRFHRSAFETSVTVVQTGEERYLQLDGKTTGSTEIDDQATQGMLGALPAALHPDPKSAFVIGLGTGQTPAEVLRFPVERVDCAEISPEVVLTMDLFDMVNRRCDQDPRFRMLEADGRTVLRHGARKYDLVISEPSNVWIPGVAHLFTKESFEDVRGRLAEGGLCMQWLQGYGLALDTLRDVVRTFLQVFPHATLWFSGLPTPDLLLIGSTKPLSIDVGALDRRLGAAGVVNVCMSDRPLTAFSLLRRFVAGPDALRRFAGDGPLTSDARPSLEYAAEEGLFAATPVLGGTLGSATDPARQILAQFSEPPLALLVPGPDGSIDADLRKLLERRCEANRALSRVLLDSATSATGAPTSADLAQLLALAQRFPDDDELRSALVSILASPISMRLVAGDRSDGLFEFMRRVIAAAPSHPESIKFAAMLAALENRGAEALSLIERFQSASQPWRVSPRLDRGRMLWQLGRPREALSVFADSVARSPYYLSAWREYVKALESMKDPALPSAQARLELLEQNESVPRKLE